MFICNCGNQFKLSYLYRFHCRQHFELKQLVKCYYCGHKLYSYGVFKRHLRKHTIDHSLRSPKWIRKTTKKLRNKFNPKSNDELFDNEVNN